MLYHKNVILYTSIEELSDLAAIGQMQQSDSDR